MSVTVVYKYEPVDETQTITANFEDWVATLTTADQDAVRLAQRKFGTKVKVLESISKLQVTYAPEMTCVWATSADADAGIPTVTEWDAVQARYLAANNAKVTVTRT